MQFSEIDKFGAKGTALQAYMTELPDNRRKIGELHIIETVYLQPFEEGAVCRFKNNGNTELQRDVEEEE